MKLSLVVVTLAVTLAVVACGKRSTPAPPDAATATATASKLPPPPPTPDGVIGCADSMVAIPTRRRRST